MKQKLTLLCFIIASTLFAQEAKKSYSFSLEQSIEYAVKNSYSMINANRDVEAAKKEKMGNNHYGFASIKWFC